MIYVNTCEYQISYEHDGQEWGSWSAQNEFSVSSVHKGKIDGGAEAFSQTMRGIISGNKKARTQ